MSVPSSRSVVSHTLAQGRLGVWPLVFTVMAAAAPLTVVAGGATAGFAVTGITGIPLAYLVVAAVLAVFTIGYVAMSGRVANAGAFYTYIAHGLGKAAGVAASFVAVVAYNVMQVGLYGGFGVACGALIAAEFGVTWPWGAWAGLGWAVVAVLGGRRIDLNGRVLAVLLIGEIVVAVVFAVVQVAHPAGGTVSYTTLLPGNLFTGTVAAVAGATAIAGFVGFEGTAVLSEEARDPRRTIRRATYLALGIIGVLYALCAWAMSVATGPDRIVERATAEGSELIFSLSGPYLPAIVVTIGRFFFVTSLLAALIAFHNTIARYYFALGREGVLPAALGRTSPKTKAPVYGSVLQSATGAAGIALFVLAGWDPFTQMFFWLTVLGGFGVLVLMTVTSIAVVVYFGRQDHHDVSAAQRIVAPVAATLLLGVLLVATVANFDVLIGVAPTSPVRWMLPGSFAVAAVLGLCWAWILKARRPAVYAAIGLGANAVVTDSSTSRPAGVQR